DLLFSLLAPIWMQLGGLLPPGTVELPVLRFAEDSLAVLYSIACNDIAWSPDVALYARNVRFDRQLWPITAGFPANLWPCAFWQQRPIEPAVKVTDDGPRNVLIVQNLRDPATPWIGAFGMRTAFGSRAAMVSQDAGGHTVYGIHASDCTASIATAFLVDGVLPAKDRFCDGPSPEDAAVLDAEKSWPKWVRPMGGLG
ncbi:MAG TPA: alpha/beta hydrolase, partial [Candidatus Limnocylindrales bacterium]